MNLRKNITILNQEPINRTILKPFTFIFYNYDNVQQLISDVIL